MNKKILIVGIPGLLLLGGAVFYFLSQKNASEDISDQLNGNTSFPENGYFPLGTKDENKIIYQKIQSFIKTAKPRGAPGVYLISEYPAVSAPSSVPDYSITYFQDGTAFVITLYRRPFAEMRMRAEQDLIQKLNISQKEACNLNVNLGTIASVDENLSGRNFGLSFCPNSVPFPTE